MAEFKLGRIRFVWKNEWSTASTYFVDDVVRYGGKTYICRQGHTSNLDFYTDLNLVPSRWEQMSDGQEWRDSWVVSTSYNQNDIVRYGGILYIANTPHISAATIVLGLEEDLSNWDIFAEGLDWKGSWLAETRYKRNDLVKYGGYTYVCNESHTSAASTSDGLEADQSNWDVFNAGIEYKGAWSGIVRYKINDVVKQGANLWICIDEHTSSSDFIADSGLYWETFVEGLEFENDWTNSTTYQPGDIVRYGGNQYVALTNHTNENPVTSTSNWSIFSEGIRFEGEWNSSALYRIGSVVTVGGYSYLAVADSNNSLPPSADWQQIVSGLDWKNSWSNGTAYRLGDLVRYETNVYFCVAPHTADTITNRPDVDTEGDFWNLFSVGTETSPLSVQGDLVYFSGSGPTRLPVGREGQVLRSNGTDPEWATLGEVDQVYFVAEHGEDKPSPVFGKTWDKPFKTIRYACEQVENGPRNPNAQYLLELNRVFIQREVTEFITDQITNATGGSIWENFEYDTDKCERDVGFIVDRIIWDIGHGGNLKIRAAAQSLLGVLGDGPFSKPEEQQPYGNLSVEGEQSVSAYTYLKSLIEDVLNNEAPSVNYQNLNSDLSTAKVTQYINTDLPAEATAFEESSELIDVIITALDTQDPSSIPERYVPNTLIQVATGRYRETLPIIVPAYTCILGDELRSTNAGPASSLIDIEDSFYTINTFDHIAEVVAKIVTGESVTPTSGNTVTQSQAFPFADESEAVLAEQLVQVMKHQSDYRLGTMHTAFLTDPDSYNANARTLVKANKKYVQEEVIAFLAANYPDLRYGKTDTRRDVGYIVDAIIYDLTYGGNALSIQAGLAYFNAADPLQPLIPASIKQATLDAIAFLKQRLAQVAGNTPHQPLQTTVVRVTGTAGQAGDITLIENNLDDIIEIVDDGPTVVGTTVTLVDPTPADGVNSTQALIDAWTELEGELSTISAATVAFINTNFPTLVYSEVKAARDTEIVLKAVGFDFMFDSNYQTIKAAWAYLRESVSSVYSSKLLKDATRASLEFARTQAILNVDDDATAIARINSLMKTVDDIIFGGSNEGDVCQAEARNIYYANLQLERNREFIVAEVAAYVANEWPGYEYNQALCLRDVGTYIDAIKWDIVYSSNYKSRYVARYYANAVVGSFEEDMYYLRDGTGVRNQTLADLNGDLTPPNEYGTSRVTAGAYASLDPGWGPADFRTWIINRSPYVQNVTTFGNAAIGQKIDGALHNGGNDSIVSNDFTQVISDGIGAWVANNGRAELVSVFSYYAHIGYLTTEGGRIRGTNGNNSYGEFGAVAEGFDDTETANTAVVDNRLQFNATIGSIFTAGGALQAFEFENAGIDYTEVSYAITGGGINASIEGNEFRNGSVFEVRLLDNAPVGEDGMSGGFGYITNSNTAQGGSSTTIILAQTDPQADNDYIGMKVIITGGTGVGQFGIITAYNSGTKVATVSAGWSHVVPGTTIVNPDGSSTYTVEPAISFTAPPFSSETITSGIASGFDPGQVAFVKSTATYLSAVGSSANGSGAEFNIIKRSTKYRVFLAEGGSGYERLDTITIDGSDLGGVDTVNDIVITVTSVNSITGAVEGFDFEGIGQGGNFIATESSGSTAAQIWRGGASWATVATLTSSIGIASGAVTTILESTQIVSGEAYVIQTVGDSLFNAIGANINAPGQYFVASASGTGTGTVVPVQDIAVAVTGAGASLYSTDGGETWTAGGSLPTGTWVGVAYGQGRWIAIDSAGLVAYSVDGGQNWIDENEAEITLELPGSETWTAIAYGAGKFVAIGTGTAVAYTTNGGETWTAGTGIASSDWSSITFGNNRFVAVSSTSGTVAAYSINGIAWTASTLPSSGSWTDVTYGQGVFLAVRGNTSAATSEDGITWSDRTLSVAVNHAAFGDISQAGRFVAVAEDTSSITLVGATAKARAFVADNRVFSIRITEPGSNYATAPTMTITDPNEVFLLPFTVRIGKGVLANPSYINRGSQFSSANAEVNVQFSDGYADFLQSGIFVAVRRITQRPVPGSNVTFSHLPDRAFKLVQVVTFRGEVDGSYTAFYQISPPFTPSESPADGVAVTTRIRYSQVRLTGHDFLDIGTGGFTTTNYPNAPLEGFAADPVNETVENNGGRVFFTSTDQDGNFRVGNLFAIEQSTGVATLNADAFNISGLQELNLGNVTLGGGSATVTEFSTDPFFTADSDNIVPTQRAIKAYIASQIGGGGATLNVNKIIAGNIEISTNQITNVTGDSIKMNATFEFRGGVTGYPVAWNYFLS